MFGAIIGAIDSIKKLFERKCTFCGSKSNIKSTVVNTFAYFYCNKASCIAKMRDIEKKRIF